MTPRSAFGLPLGLALFTLLLPPLGASTSALDQWARWRGPLATGLAPQGDPPLSWSETRNIQWKSRVPGFGSGTPVIWENQVFLLTAMEREEGNRSPTETAAATPRNRFGITPPTQVHEFVVLSIDRQTGQTLWRRTANALVPHEGHHGDHGFASASPVTDGEVLLAFFGSRGLYCYDLQGELKWARDLGDMETRNNFGEGSSPALHGDIIIVNWDHEGEDFIVALDRDTGRERWRRERNEPTTWATPLVVEHEGQTQVVVNGTTAARSYDLKTGEVLWECGGQTVNAIPTPVAGHGMAYVMSGFRGATLKAIRLGSRGTLSGPPAVAWSRDRDTPYVPSPLLYGQLLYFAKRNSGRLTCLDAKSGRAFFTAEQLPQINGIYASPVGAAGRVYVVGRNGTSVVLKNSGKLDVLAINPLEDRIDASPAIVGRQLFLRGHRYLYCIAETDRASATVGRKP